jgi:hypothetical protein
MHVAQSVSSFFFFFFLLLNFHSKTSCTEQVVRVSVACIMSTITNLTATIAEMQANVEALTEQNEGITSGVTEMWMLVAGIFVFFMQVEAHASAPVNYAIPRFTVRSCRCNGLLGNAMQNDLMQLQRDSTQRDAMQRGATR